MIIYRWKHSSIKMHAIGILQGFAEIEDGIVTVISFATLASGFEMAVARKRAFVHLQEVKQTRGIKK